jgi:acyl-CoA synthetase (AMP-forming)/AMP-acid ligase II
MQWFTYGQVLEMAFGFCRDLETRRIGKGERVMLWGENCAEWVAAFFGCALCGVVVVPMDNGASADFAARVSAQVEAKLWVCSRRHGPDLAGQARAVPVLLLEVEGGWSFVISSLASTGIIGREDILQTIVP